MITLLDTVVFTLKAEEDLEEGVYYLHMDYKFPVFNKTILKSLFAQWKLILEELDKRGIHTVASVIPKQDTKVIKWQKIFGLVEVERHDNLIIFERNTKWDL